MGDACLPEHVQLRIMIISLVYGDESVARCFPIGKILIWRHVSCPKKKNESALYRVSIESCCHWGDLGATWAQGEEAEREALQTVV